MFADIPHSNGKRHTLDNDFTMVNDIGNDIRKMKRFCASENDASDDTHRNQLEVRIESVT